MGCAVRIFRDTDKAKLIVIISDERSINNNQQKTDHHSPFNTMVLTLFSAIFGETFERIGQFYPDCDATNQQLSSKTIHDNG
jgi:hypothetical protein